MKAEFIFGLLKIKVFILSTS